MSSSKYADEGTIAHILAAMCLTEGKDALAYLGRLIESEDYEHAKLSPSSAKRWMTCAGSHALIQANAGVFEPRSFSLEVTEEMAEHVQVYVDMVRARVEARKLAGAIEVTLYVEQSLPIDHITGEPGATGTGDAVIVSVWPDYTAMLDLIDLKSGMGVEVEVEGNEQLQLYGSGALRILDMIYDFTNACLTVHQPRIKKEPSDWEIDISVLRDFEKRAESRAKDAHIAMKFFSNWSNGPDYSWLVPGDHCRKTFCDARADCPAYNNTAKEFGADDFENLDSTTFSPADVPSPEALDFIEDWMRVKRAEIERRLFAGEPATGWKLVQGKRGHRAWTDADKVETTFKSMRLKSDEMYNYKLISPADAEKLLKDTPKRWNRVKELITQPEGKPSVAPESDKRPALVIEPVEDAFENLEDDLAG